ncbi:MAG: DUF115 domain-containing protein [Spirochaetes bacterium]|nr:DUF115 domain-containing protein [Spirochaetota bacterium]
MDSYKKKNYIMLMDEYVKEIGRNGLVTYKYNGKYLYSIYDPEREANKYLNTIKNIKKVVITCCGADYINKELLNRGVDLIISFNPVKFEQAVNSDKLIRADTLADVEKILLSRNIHSSQISIIYWPLLIETNKSVYLNQLKKLKDILLKVSISSNTAKVFGFLETKNILINLINLNSIEFIKRSFPHDNLSLILSSGYSLSKYIDFIKRIKDRAIVFALPSALPFLLHHNIEPDFAVCVDPGYASFYHLYKYKRIVKLICPLSLTQSIFKMNNVYPQFFNYTNIFENILFENYNAVASAPEGSVFINLLRILTQLGFKDALVIGQDFGYMNNRSHINEGSFEREYCSISNYFQTLESKIINFDHLKENSIIEIDKTEIKSNIALKLYYEHFINNNYEINILLPDSVYNPIDKSIKKVNIDYITRNFSCKDKINTIISTEKINDLKKIKDLFKNVINQIKNNNYNEEIEKLINNLYIDKNNLFHINKIKKIYRGLV